MTGSDRPHPYAPPDWDARYAGDDFLFGTEPNRFLVECRDRIPAGGRVLCVADGEGRNSVWLAEQGFRVDAFDRSPVGVAKARRLAEDRGVAVRYAVADMEGWDWPVDVYDAVAAIFVQFSTPPERRRMFARIATALRPGGVLLLQGYEIGQMRYGTGGPRAPDQLYTEPQLRAELGAFTIERLVVHEADLREGSQHSGMSVLVDVVASTA